MIKLLMIMIFITFNNHKIKKNIVPIKDINPILKINKKVCSQADLEG